MNAKQIFEKAKRREIRLVVCDGHVTSVADGDRHYVGPASLLHLYGVPHDVPYVMYPSRKDEFFGWRDLPSDVQLVPLRNGDYNIEKAYERSVGAHADT
jgi:hypothetical protein